MSNNKKISSLSLIGLIASVIGIVAFLTGRPYLRDYFGSKNAEQGKLSHEGKETVKNERSQPNTTRVTHDELDQGTRNNNDRASNFESDNRRKQKTNEQKYVPPQSYSGNIRIEDGSKTTERPSSRSESSGNLPSNIEQSNLGKPKDECEINNTGDCCFINESQQTVVLFFCSSRIQCEPLNQGHSGGIDAAEYIIMRPQDSKCFYGLSTANTYNYKAFAKPNGNLSDYDMRYQCYNSTPFDQGQAKAERCKSRTYTVR